MNVSTTFRWCGHEISTTMFNSDCLHKHRRRNTGMKMFRTQCHVNAKPQPPPMSVRPPHDQTKLTVNNHVVQTQPKMTTFVVCPNTRTDVFPLGHIMDPNLFNVCTETMQSCVVSDAAMPKNHHTFSHALRQSVLYFLLDRETTHFFHQFRAQCRVCLHERRSVYLAHVLNSQCHFSNYVQLCQTL